MSLSTDNCQFLATVIPYHELYRMYLPALKQSYCTYLHKIMTILLTFAAVYMYVLYRYYRLQLDSPKEGPLCCFFLLSFESVMAEL